MSSKKENNEPFKKVRLNKINHSYHRESSSKIVSIKKRKKLKKLQNVFLKCIKKNRNNYKMENCKSKAKHKNDRDKSFSKYKNKSIIWSNVTKNKKKLRNLAKKNFLNKNRHMKNYLDLKKEHKCECEFKESENFSSRCYTIQKISSLEIYPSEKEQKITTQKFFVNDNVVNVNINDFSRLPLDSLHTLHTTCENFSYLFKDNSQSSQSNEKDLYFNDYSNEDMEIFNNYMSQTYNFENTNKVLKMLLLHNKMNNIFLSNYKQRQTNMENYK